MRTYRSWAVVIWIAVWAALAAQPSYAAVPHRGYVQAPSTATTVLTLEPLDLGTDSLTNLMATVLQGFATAAGRVQQRVAESSNLTWAGLQADAAALNTALTATPGPKVVLGWSRGAQVASVWLQTYAGTAGAPSPSQLSFILLGNPQRRLGGRPGGETLDGVALQPTPDTTAYTVLDISRRWDGWSNWDDWPAMSSADQGRLILGMWVDHANYSNVGVADPTNQTRATVGNTTYVVTTS
ncbi:PE-PPE domain-containing protein [Tsukamurella soli]|uniref:PE-PPE domain-containing protein n=1 Tax=Tsukamurella soli TaxID=644556 RepID=A0ABP8K1D1_9ACTN